MHTISEPSKLKAEVTYNAAADHFDDGRWHFGIDTADAPLKCSLYRRDRWCLMSDAVVALPLYQPP
jgi:hypothetical protein